MTERRSKANKFTMVGHAHLDPVWLWERQEGIEAVKATFRSALDRMAENPDLVFVHTSAAQYAWMEVHPDLMAEIRAAVTRGQWEPVGGWWVEPDVNIPSGEALARQALYGQRYFERALGRRARVGFLPDSFGHPVTLPQILKLSGLDYFVFWRPIGPEIDLPSNLFWWEGPDGTRMLSARLETYNSNPNQVVDTLTASIDWRPADSRDWLVVYGVGNHGGGPTKKAIANLRGLMADPAWPTIQMGTVESFFERVATRSHPVFDQGLQYSFRGCYTSHSQVKRLNRKGEQALVTAEKWSAIASRYGLAYPGARLERAWKHVLFNQFHDILCGTSIPSAYEDSTNEQREAIGTGRRSHYDALQVIAQQIDTRSGDHSVEEAMRRVRTGPGNAVADMGDGVPIIVFNPSAWPRKEVIDVELNDWHIADMQVLDDKNQPVLHQFAQGEAGPPRKRAVFTAEVPALGYRLYRIVDRPPTAVAADAGLLEASFQVLENGWWRLELDPRTGALRSLRDKRLGRELLAGAGAQVLVMDDPFNPWGKGDYIRHLTGVFADPAVELIEDGPVRATWRINTRWGNSTARQEISIYRDSPAIHGRLEIDWHEEFMAAKLAFPFALEGAEATFSLPFGHTTRPAGGQEEPSQQWLDVTGYLAGSGQSGEANWAQAGEDGGAVTGPGSRGKQNYGVALLNDCKYGADVLGGEARLTLLRSPIYGAGNKGARPLRPVDRYLDQGLQEMRWALVPHAGPWQQAGVVQTAQDFNEPMTFVREYAHHGVLPKVHSFLLITPSDEVVLTALKKAEEGEDWIIRLYEPRGRSAHAAIQIPLLGAAFAVEAGPHQIKSYRVSPAGAVSEVNFLEE